MLLLLHAVHKHFFSDCTTLKPQSGPGQEPSTSWKIAGGSQAGRGGRRAQLVEQRPWGGLPGLRAAAPRRRRWPPAEPPALTRPTRSEMCLLHVTAHRSTHTLPAELLHPGSDGCPDVFKNRALSDWSFQTSHSIQDTSCFVRRFPLSAQSHRTRAAEQQERHSRCYIEDLCVRGRPAGCEDVGCSACVSRSSGSHGSRSSSPPAPGLYSSSICPAQTERRCNTNADVADHCHRLALKTPHPQPPTYIMT